MDVFRQYCEEQVRAFDRDRYLAALFAPEHHRGALLALYAFDIELSRIRELAREPMPGEIRLQWWREIVDGEREGEARAHPVAAALLDAIDSEWLARERLQVMIDARSFDLYNEPFQRVTDWDGYADRTVVAVIDSAMTVLAGRGVVASELSLHAGRALFGLRMLLQLRADLSRGRCLVPLEVLNRFGAAIDEGLQGRMTSEWQAALAEIRSRVRRNLDAAADLVLGVPETALPALLPCAVVRATLARMDRNSYDPLRPHELPAWRRQWLIWRAARSPRRIFG